MTSEKPPNDVPQVTFEVALREMRRATEEAVNAPWGVEGLAAREYARQIRTEIVSEIRLRNPDAAEKYERGLDEYERGLLFLRALKESGASQGPTGPGESATFDAAKLMEYMQNNSLSEQLPHTWNALVKIKERRNQRERFWRRVRLLAFLAVGAAIILGAGLLKFLG